jgi:hypothetical protein
MKHPPKIIALSYGSYWHVKYGPIARLYITVKDKLGKPPRIITYDGSHEESFDRWYIEYLRMYVMDIFSQVVKRQFGGKVGTPVHERKLRQESPWAS